jgi:hypothetical protein
MSCGETVFKTGMIRICCPIKLNYFGFQNKNRFWAVLSGKKISVWARLLAKKKILKKPKSRNTFVRNVEQRLRRKNKPVNPGKFSGLSSLIY